MANSPIDIERRVETLLAAGRYVRATDRFKEASVEFKDACSVLRTVLAPRCRFVAKLDFRHFIITCNDQGEFEVEQIESL
ncbi:MAG: hypothetical protein SGI77_22815 [Pirellulaceae bacterium]|nr:hypothetical protein [Pirellulaceae bacterium]